MVRHTHSMHHNSLMALNVLTVEDEGFWKHFHLAPVRRLCISSPRTLHGIELTMCHMHCFYGILSECPWARNILIGDVFHKSFDFINVYRPCVLSVVGIFWLTIQLYPCPNKNLPHIYIPTCAYHSSHQSRRGVVWAVDVEPYVVVHEVN